MAHICKCKICEERFDRDLIPAVFANAPHTRYAHKTCLPVNHFGEVPLQDLHAKSDYEKLKDYIDFLFEGEVNWKMISKQIANYKKKYGYTDVGIHQTLLYFYSIKKNDIMLANNNIGIVPYMYEEAQKYFTYQKVLKEAAERDLSNLEYNHTKTTITISKPVADVKPQKLFDI